MACTIVTMQPVVISGVLRPCAICDTIQRHPTDHDYEPAMITRHTPASRAVVELAEKLDWPSAHGTHVFRDWQALVEEPDLEKFVWAVTPDRTHLFTGTLGG